MIFFSFLSIFYVFFGPIHERKVVVKIKGGEKTVRRGGGGGV